MLKRASFWLAMALCICAIGGLATVSTAAPHKKIGNKQTVPKAVKPLLKDCLAHNGKLKHRYSRHKKVVALHFLQKYVKTNYVRSLSTCERNLAKNLHIKLPKPKKKK